MMLDVRREKTYCNCLAQERGLDPAGHGRDFDDAIVVEVPLPWKADMYQKPGALPQEILDLLALWLEHYRAGQGYPHRPLVVAPDPTYTREGYRRVMFYTRRQGMIAAFDKVEYHVPLHELGALVWSLYEDRDALPRFETYRVPAMDNVRDLLVCTHGTIDAACSKFGYPLYKHLRDNHAHADLRVWRVSHFGGHVFAPTLIEMPTGHYWAYVGESQGVQIARRSGFVSDLRGHYRGWAGVTDGFLQAADCELWQRHGWAWFDYLKAGEVLAQDATNGADPKWADVRMTYTLPDGSAPRAVDLRVEVTGYVETEPSTGKPNVSAYPQYRVVHTVEVE